MQRTLQRYFYMDHAPGESFDCQWLSGCFLMLRNKAVEKIGLFDESFGKYFEDVDMCLRMARRVAGDVPRRDQRLSHRAAGQPQVVFRRRLEASAIVYLLAEQVGLPRNGGSTVLQDAAAAGGVKQESDDCGRQCKLRPSGAISPGRGSWLLPDA